MSDAPKLHSLEQTLAHRRARLQEARNAMTGYELAFVGFVEAMGGAAMAGGVSVDRIAELYRHMAAEFELLCGVIPDVSGTLQGITAGFVNEVRERCDNPKDIPP